MEERPPATAEEQRPNWADPQSVRAWHLGLARSLETTAMTQESGVQMFRGMATSLREAAPPWPAEGMAEPSPKKDDTAT